MHFYQALFGQFKKAVIPDIAWIDPHFAKIRSGLGARLLSKRKPHYKKSRKPFFRYLACGRIELQKKPLHGPNRCKPILMVYYLKLNCLAASLVMALRWAEEACHKDH